MLIFILWPVFLVMPLVAWQASVDGLCKAKAGEVEA
jgi:hypothetical protein